VKDSARQTVSLKELGGVKLWDLDAPHLYTVHVRLLQGGKVIDEDNAQDRLPRGGIHRSWLFAEWQGRQAARAGPAPDLSVCRQAMPARVQRQDAKDSAPRTALQHRADVALPTIPALPGLLR